MQKIPYCNIKLYNYVLSMLCGSCFENSISDQTEVTMKISAPGAFVKNENDTMIIQSKQKNCILTVVGTDMWIHKN